MTSDLRAGTHPGTRPGVSVEGVLVWALSYRAIRKCLACRGELPARTLQVILTAIY